MAFTKPQYDRHIVDLAGDALVGHASASDDLRLLYDPDDIINNWRSAHAYPLNTFQMTLRRRALREDDKAIVAQRIKRRSSIKAKLERMHDLKLSEMQDIAGCRAIVSSVEQVYALVNSYKRRYSHHKLDDESDYIRNPKSDGYRSYHLIYRYYNEDFPAYERLKIEMQFRSVLQHCWATAVEVADIFYREGLKAHLGSPSWRRFFALMGAAIAMHEQCRRVPRTPDNWQELISELRTYARQLDIQTRLNAFGRTLNVIGETEARRAGIKYVLLLLNPGAGNEQLRLFGFRASSIEEATRQYEKEERLKSGNQDAVLVSVSDATTLRRAYPSYFLDTTVFLKTLGEFIS